MDTVKILSDIAFQEITSISVYSVKFVKEPVQPVHREKSSFLPTTGCVIVDKMPFKKRGKDIVTQTVLNNPIPVMECVDFPFFGIVDHDCKELSMFSMQGKHLRGM